VKEVPVALKAAQEGLAGPRVEVRLAAADPLEGLEKAAAGAPQARVAQRAVPPVAVAGERVQVVAVVASPLAPQVQACPIVPHLEVAGHHSVALEDSAGQRQRKPMLTILDQRHLAIRVRI